jgi:hypothetical protein
MAKLSWRGLIRRRLAAPLVALAVLGVVILATRNAPAQSGTKEVPVKKGDKAEPKGKILPQVVDKIPPGTPGIEQILYINELTEKQWADNKITPAERCSDYDFIRRASLDIIGRIAKVHEIDLYMKDAPEYRRAKLVERLLASEEYAGDWANYWSIMMLTRSGGPKVHQAQMTDWLAEKLVENKKTNYVPDWSKIVTEIVTASGRTNENGAVNFILAHMGERITQDTASNGTYEMVPVTSRTTRLFLGLRTQCVQCHDHPFNGEWGQHHF